MEGGGSLAAAPLHSTWAPGPSRKVSCAAPGPVSQGAPGWVVPSSEPWVGGQTCGEAAPSVDITPWSQAPLRAGTSLSPQVKDANVPRQPLHSGPGALTVM